MKHEGRNLNGRQRLRREDPVRTEPIRNWSTLYRRPNSWGFRIPSANPQAADQVKHSLSENNVVSRGVEIGYRVVEEHIRQGQHVAQQIHTRSSRPGAMSNNIRELVEQLARYYTDLGSLWGDLVNSLMADPDFFNNLFRPWQPQPTPVMNGTSAPGGRTVAIEVASTRPTQVTLDLHPHSERLSLTTYGLHAVDPQKSPLTDITFESNPDHGPVRLCVRVPDGQPPDVYTGVVVDTATNQPRGTLSVRIGT